MNISKTILYIGDTNPGRTSFHRMNALKTLGYKILLIDQDTPLTNGLYQFFSKLGKKLV